MDLNNMTNRKKKRAKRKKVIVDWIVFVISLNICPYAIN